MRHGPVSGRSFWPRRHRPSVSGNLWRFPYLAAKYGGGMFLLTYLVLVLTFGVSLLLLETALERKTRLSVIGAFRHFGAKFTFIGVLAAAVPFIITPYYCIIGGWVTKYMVSYVTAGPAALADGGDFFGGFISSNTESFLFMLVFMAIVFIIVALGVQKGIEKANLVMMPALIIMAVAIAAFVLTMPGALEGAAYYLVPDFSKFSPELVINALGQMFYSLSLAMGIMVTYGSYMRKQDSLTSSVTRIAGFDFGVSFFAGLMIVPAAFVAMGSAEAVAAKSGPSLMFITPARGVQHDGRHLGDRHRLRVLPARVLRGADKCHQPDRGARVDRVRWYALVAHQVAHHRDDLYRGGRVRRQRGL